MRVYRLRLSQFITHTSSLIICEGVSTSRCQLKRFITFPHYMWGCIVLLLFCSCIELVPSLYVRVYRTRNLFQFVDTCSLIICEGVSAISAASNVISGVPSLYVRVYRPSSLCCSRSISSLIICEGVSCLDFHLSPLNTFPHYMWGCIAASFSSGVLVSVPSLYVRVYRRHRLPRSKKSRSLIICEGVSFWAPPTYFCPSFPHYMWGCIGTFS